MTKLVKGECIRLGKKEIKKEILRTLREMPEGIYYKYCLEAFSEKEYIKRESEKREAMWK